MYLFASAGAFEGEETTAQLENEGSSGGLSVGIGVRPWRYLALEAELAGFAAKYDRPPLSVPAGVSFDPRMRVSTGGVIGNAKAYYALGGVALYVGAGLGLFASEAELEGTLFGFDAERIEDDSGFGYQLMAGVETAVGERSHIGLQYRRLELEADFGELSRGKTDVGGDYIALTFRHALR